MGNAAVTPCFHPKNSSSSSSSKLIFWDGTMRCLKGKHIAGEIMYEFPDKVVCHADSFFIGHPIPALALEDELIQGEAYFVLPIDSFTCKTLSISSLLSLGSDPSKSTIKFGECPFEYLKGSNGRVLIKVMPEFITRLINRSKRPCCPSSNDNNNFLCSTPELRKHYQMLVKSKDQVWSPKLETISENKQGLDQALEDERPASVNEIEWTKIQRREVSTIRLALALEITQHVEGDNTESLVGEA
ncbi:hypothetical protein D0Y65_048205 [Glycine soja]|uniref:DUF4228 domain-containing protein n=1 Tax=Glycine soja TaxID=3848 RepID=A0A445FS08_GLYSO|nr:hypothetical protein D0Y65_048205 [Glycine soja]